MACHFAQINIALIAPIDDPKIAEFVSLLEPVNALADQAPGFVWRLIRSSSSTYGSRSKHYEVLPIVPIT
jgi:hypothetical protein